MSSSGTWAWIYRPLATSKQSACLDLSPSSCCHSRFVHIITEKRFDESSDLRLFIKLDDETAFVDNIYHVELFRHQEMSADLMACHETDDPMNQHLTVTFSQSDQHQHWMTFHNRSLGYYCVLVIPEDDRCHPPFVDFERTCARHSNVVQLIGLMSSLPFHFNDMRVDWRQFHIRFMVWMVFNLCRNAKRGCYDVLFNRGRHGILDNRPGSGPCDRVSHARHFAQVENEFSNHFRLEPNRRRPNNNRIKPANFIILQPTEWPTDWKATR